MAGNWTDQAQYGDWTYWGGDKSHNAGWYGVGDVKNWTPIDQWDPSKHQSYSGWKYDLGSGSFGIVDPNTGKTVLAPPGSAGPTGITSTWTPEMQQQYQQWYGQQQAAAGSKTSGYGNITQGYGDQTAAYAAGQLAGNQGGTKAGQAAAAATTKYGTPPGNLPGPLENYWATIGQHFNQPGLYEQWAQQAMQGTNPYYNRLRADTANRINQQGAARGTYNSGATMAALGNADAALTAQQFQDMGNMVQGAQNAELQRLLTGGTLAGNAQGAGQTRLGNALTAGNGANNAIAQAILAAYGSGAGSNFSADALSALANSFGLGAQGGMANSQNALGLLAMLFA